MEQAKIGIVGAGGIGSVHAKILNASAKVKIVGIVDVDENQADILSRKYGGKAYSDYKKFLEDASPQAIYITVPNALHTNLALEAARRRVNVFSEKPMATSLQEARKIFEAVEKSGILYQIGFNKRFAPLYKKVKEIIEKRQPPPLVLVKMNRGGLKNPCWVSDPKISGGFLYETAIHVLDIVRFFFGEVEKVSCLAKSNVYSNQLDDFIITLTFKNGIVASIISSGHATWMFPFERIEIFGDHWCIETEEYDRLSYSPGLDLTIEIKDFSQLDREARWGYVEEDSKFIEAVLGETTAPATHLDGLKAVEIVEACYRSAEKKVEIKLPLEEE